ncbi:MAG TPA: VOC family protein [Xanthobacteraceae bacterium]|nr:VOC family protein [Xanthobacteraceae bacterium]
MLLQALGYVGVRAKALEDWSDYGTRLLGLQIADKSSKSMALRMDDRKQRLMVDADGGQGVSVFGWEVADAAGLDAVAARLEAAGVKVARGSRALADQRLVKDLITLNDPAGNRLEIFHGAHIAAEPFVPGRNMSGFRTGIQGLGHVVLQAKQVTDELISFYRDTLGFGVSDFYHQPFTAYFFHVNPRHHSFALIQSDKDSVHHLMLEMFSFDDVGQGYDLALGEEGRLAVTLGRHAGDYMTSFYTWTPSGFMIESGWGGREIDPATWVPTPRLEGPSLWGHDRSWLPPDVRAKARATTLKAAADGFRRPVQVMEGNYDLMTGVCPWWDGMKKAGAA